MILPFTFTRNRTPGVFHTANQLLVTPLYFPPLFGGPKNGLERFLVSPSKPKPGLQKESLFGWLRSPGTSLGCVLGSCKAFWHGFLSMRVLNILHSPFSLDHTVGGAYIPYRFVRLVL